jgi:hypothetical protein
MRSGLVTLSIAAMTAAAIPHFASAPVKAQAGGQRFAAPRTSAGQPNLQGVWRVWNLAKFDLEDHPAKPGVPAGRGFVIDPPDGRIPYQPAALKKRQQNYANTRDPDPGKNADPLAKCYLPGIPRMTYLGFPFQIIQTPQYVLFSYEWSHQRRFVTLTGNPPPADDEGTWLGIGRGRFDGDSLVIDLTNFNGYTWFDMAGNFHSDALREVERYTPIDADTLQYDVRIEDPKVFTRPWAIRMMIQRQTDIGILDYECTAMLDEMGFHHTWPREFEVN